MTRIKTSELIGSQLDWAVERSKGTAWINGYFCYPKDDPDFTYPYTNKTRHYSSDWSQGGPIIQRECITHGPWDTSPFMAHIGMSNTVSSTNVRFVGPTPLIAAMRAYVARKLGDEVEIPDELT